MNQLNLPEFRVLKVEENEQKDLKFTVEAIKPIENFKKIPALTVGSFFCAYFLIKFLKKIIKYI